MTVIPLQALAGGSAPVNVIPVRTGFYQARLCRGAVWVAIRIWIGFGRQDGRDHFDGTHPIEELRWQPTPVIIRGWRWRAERDGIEVELFDVWPGCSGSEIAEKDYRYLRAMRIWAAQHNQVDHPYFDPRKPVDFANLPIDFRNQA